MSEWNNRLKHTITTEVPSSAALSRAGVSYYRAQGSAVLIVATFDDSATKQDVNFRPRDEEAGSDSIVRGYMERKTLGSLAVTSLNASGD